MPVPVLEIVSAGAFTINEIALLIPPVNVDIVKATGPGTTFVPIVIFAVANAELIATTSSTTMPPEAFTASDASKADPKMVTWTVSPGIPVFGVTLVSVGEIKLGTNIKLKISAPPIPPLAVTMKE